MIDSPLLWSGKKTKLLEQLKPLFYENADTFFDVFSGSGSILANVDYERIIGNDIYSGDLLNVMLELDFELIKNHVEKNIKKYSLSKKNKQGYYEYKDYILSIQNTNVEEIYNKKLLDMYTISNFAFNGRLEFNLSGDITSSFGKRNRKNTSLIKLKKWKNAISSKNICFVMNKDYVQFCRDIVRINKNNNYDIFVYIDPPYSITRTNGYDSDYNDKKLFEILNYFDKIGIKWGMSNVFAHKGKTNNELISFANEYNTHYLDFDYSNNNRSNNLQQELEQSNETVEVYICNY